MLHANMEAAPCTENIDYAINGFVYVYALSTLPNKSC